MGRIRKPSAKLQFLEASSAAWDAKQRELTEKRPERQAMLREKKRAKLAREREKEANSRRAYRERERAKREAMRARMDDQRERAQAKQARASQNRGVKRALSAYMFFASEVRTEVKERYPNASFGEARRQMIYLSHRELAPSTAHLSTKHVS